MPKTKKLISIVIPSYNEEKNVERIYRKILEIFDTKKYDFEIIFVNDGSKDDTWVEIASLAKDDKRVQGVCFSRNFGHASALQAGLERANGDAAIMLDADLQQPPELIPELIRLWEEGSDIVNTIRLSTDGTGWFKNLTSRLFYKLLNTISELELHEGEADFRLLDRKVVDVLNKMPESPKFYRGLVNWLGFNIIRVEYKASARKYGKSSFTFKKMMEMARLGLTSFSMKPLKVIIAIGIFESVFSLIGLIVMVAVKIFVNFGYFSNNAILLVFMVFVTGLLATFQGIVAIYLVDIFHFAKGRPAYIVGEQVGRSLTIVNRS